MPYGIVPPEADRVHFFFFLFSPPCQRLWDFEQVQGKRPSNIFPSGTKKDHQLPELFFFFFQHTFKLGSTTCDSHVLSRHAVLPGIHYLPPWRALRLGFFFSIAHAGFAGLLLRFWFPPPLRLYKEMQSAVGDQRNIRLPSIRSKIAALKCGPLLLPE